MPKLLATFQPDVAIGYGSGMIQQQGYTPQDKPMLDFIFGVKDTFSWHERNLAQRPQDYSVLAKQKGLRFINKLQEKGPGVYYHPFVNFEGENIKYGIISSEQLLNDLHNWTTIYVAGRMHKPTITIAITPQIAKAQQQNLKHALNTALLTLPERCTTQELFTTITALSYTGDSRMKHGEHPHKINNIVTKNEEQFEALYKPHLHTKPYTIQLHNSILQDTSPKQTKAAYNKLPPRLKTEIQQLLKKQEREQPNYENREEITNLIHQGLERIIRPASIQQTKKGIYTAGLKKSLQYGLAKIRKATRN